MSLFFVNALADPARQYFLTHCSSHMPFGQIVSMMRRHYSSDTRKLQVQSEMDSLDVPSFMSKHNIADNSRGLSKLVDHINSLSPQLPTGFGDDPHKTRYLRRAAMSFEWTKQPIFQIATSKHSFIQFITALQESLQLKEEHSRVQHLDLNYGQYVRDPRDVEYPNNRYRNRTKSPSYRYQRSRSPYERDQQNRSHSPYGSRSFRQTGNRQDQRPNRNLRTKRLCCGCSSPEVQAIIFFYTNKPRNGTQL